MDNVLQQACLALVRSIADDDLVLTTYSALCVQSLHHTPHQIPCPTCWARDSTITQIPLRTLVCDRCGTRIEMPEVSAPAEVSRMDRFRDLLAPGIRNVLGHTINDDARMERLMAAAKEALRRELALLDEVTTRKRPDALGQALHMLRAQDETFDLARLSTRSRRAMQAGLEQDPRQALDDDQKREMALEVSGALREILRLIDA